MTVVVPAYHRAIHVAMRDVNSTINEDTLKIVGEKQLLYITIHGREGGGSNVK